MFLVNLRLKKVTSFKASLLLEFLSELLEPFHSSHCSESKLFNTSKKLTVKSGVPKLLRCRAERFRCLLGFIFIGFIGFTASKTYVQISAVNS